MSFFLFACLLQEMVSFISFPSNYASAWSSTVEMLVLFSVPGINILSFHRIDQKMSGGQSGYELCEAKAILSELKSIRKAISSGEREKQDLMKVFWTADVSFVWIWFNAVCFPDDKYFAIYASQGILKILWAILVLKWIFRVKPVMFLVKKITLYQSENKNWDTQNHE